MKVFRTVLAWLGALLWCAAPAGAYWWLTERSAEESFDAPVAVDGVVRENTGGSSRDVSLVLTWHAPVALVAPEWTGVVQSVAAQAGQELSSGDVVARVAGVDRLACASDYPMAQAVAATDKGQDVATLQQCLTLFGYDVARDKGTYGAATKTAVTALVKQTGAVSEKGELFDAAWLVFLPEEGYRLASVELPLAAPAPASGTVIGSAEPVLSGAVLAPRGAVEEVAAPSSSGDDGSGAGTVATATETLAAEPDEELATTGDPITLGEDRSRVSAEGLVALRRQVESGAAVVETKLVREAGAGELLVPAAAVVATPDGATCVLRVTGSSLEPVGVEVVGDTAGSSIVKAGLEPGDEVRVAPAAKDRRCG